MTKIDEISEYINSISHISYDGNEIDFAEYEGYNFEPMSEDSEYYGAFQQLYKDKEYLVTHFYDPENGPGYDSFSVIGIYMAPSEEITDEIRESLSEYGFDFDDYEEPMDFDGFKEACEKYNEDNPKNKLSPNPYIYVVSGFILKDDDYDVVRAYITYPFNKLNAAMDKYEQLVSSIKKNMI